LGYGVYEFTLEQRLDRLGEADPNVVLGLFLYRDDTHELDIEFARWGATATNATNADYVNQPNTVASKSLHWTEPAIPTGTPQTHRIDFSEGRVQWASFVSARRTRPFQTFSSTDKVPSATGMRVHLNLWAFRGVSHMQQDAVDVGIRNFTFTPHK